MDIKETGERQMSGKPIIRTFYSLVSTHNDFNRVSPSQYSLHFRAMQRFEQEQRDSFRDYRNGSGDDYEPPSAA